MGPSLETGAFFECCTVGELLRVCDSVSVMAVQEKCDEKGKEREVRKSSCVRRTWNPTPSASLRAGSFRKVREKGWGTWLFSQRARKGWGCRLLNSCPCHGRGYWLRSTPEYGENSLTHLRHGGRCRGP